MHIMGHRPHHFPAPNVNDVVPYSPGLRRSRRYPGFRPNPVPYPARGCAVRARRGVRYQRTEWDQVHGCRRGVRPECMSIIHEIHTTHIPPIPPIGTTTFGVVAHFAPTPRVTPQTAPPRASWQNPVGIPGGERPGRMGTPHDCTHGPRWIPTAPESAYSAVLVETSTTTPLVFTARS